MADRIELLLQSLYYAGVALTNAVCAAPPITNYFHLKSPALSDARACIDKTAMARSELCYEHDQSMGSLLVQNAPRERPRATSCKRSCSTCCDVETMISDYRFRGFPLAAESSTSTNPRRKADDNGGVRKARAKKGEKESKNGGHYFQAFGNPDAHANNKKIIFNAVTGGLVFSSTRRFDIQAFAFAKHSILNCAHCTGHVHCVESVVFANRKLAYCRALQPPALPRVRRRHWLRHPARRLARRRCNFCAGR